MTKSALEAELLRCGLRRYWQAAQVYVRNAVTLTAQVVDEVPFGRSHLGGAADLPLGDDQPQARCPVLQTTTPQNGKTAVAAFAFRGLKYVVEVGALRQSRRAGK